MAEGSSSVLRRIAERLRLGDDGVFVAVALMAAYVLAGRGIGSFYPVSAFPMYAKTPELPASRVFVQDASGNVRDIDRFKRWLCPDTVDLNPAECRAGGAYYYIPYVDRDVLGALAVRAEESDAELESVVHLRRIWKFSADGSTEVTDCPLAACRAVPR